MANPNRWSSSHGTRDAGRIRVYEREPGGVLYIAAWLPGEGVTRRSLGHRDRDRAKREAEQLLRARPTPAPSESAPRPLSLGELFRRYVTEGRYLPDGSLKTDAYLRHIGSAGNNLASHFGQELPVGDLTPDRVQHYVRLRRDGTISGRPVRTNTIERELTMLKGALNWARTVHEDGRPLLAHHPLESYKIPSERDPKRPVASRLAVDALLGVADAVHPMLRTLVVLAGGTGRRLSAMLNLRWDDIDLEAGQIRWRAEHDKLRQTWVVPASREVLAELRRYRLQCPGVGAALLFPHPLQQRRPGQPVTRHLAAYRLKTAYQRAGVPKPDGSLWHAFRRLWATERKSLPVKDVAAAGGWKDVTTLIECYQQPDDETLRAVVDFTRPRPGRPPQREVGQ